MKPRIFFDDFCREEAKCKNYIEWEYEYVLEDPGVPGAGRYESSMICVSCTNVGQSYNIEEYPDDCPHKKAIKRFEIKRKKEMDEFDKQCEQETIWRKLSD